MPYEKYSKFFRGHSVFTGAELAAYMALLGDVGKRTQEVALAYHLNREHILRIRRGLYAVIPPDTASEKHQVDPFLISAKVTPDAVLSHHTALDFHGHAYSVQDRFTYTARRSPLPFTFQSREFRGVKAPVALYRLGKEDAGVEVRDRSGMDIRVTTLERTLVDALHRPDVTGSWEEIWRSLESVSYFNLDQVIEHTLLLGNATTVAKVGFFLEQQREQLMVEAQHLRKLRQRRPKQPHYLERSKRSSGRLVPAWNLVVPRQVLERSWSEVL